MPRTDRSFVSIKSNLRTPNIDSLAVQGMRFTQCYAGSPVCAPSRSVLMTGQHTGHTRVRGNTGKGGVLGLGGKPGRVPFEDSDITVAEILKTTGYQTGMSGKWGLGEPGTTGLPNDQWFDFWFGFLNQRRAHSHYPDYLWLNRQRVRSARKQRRTSAPVCARSDDRVRPALRPRTGRNEPAESFFPVCSLYCPPCKFRSA